MSASLTYLLMVERKERSVERSASPKRVDPERDYEQRRRSAEKKVEEGGEPRGDSYGVSGEQMAEPEKRAGTEAEGAAGRE